MLSVTYAQGKGINEWLRMVARKSGRIFQTLVIESTSKKEDDRLWPHAHCTDNVNFKIYSWVSTTLPTYTS